MAFNIIYKSNDEEEEKKRKKLIEEGANQQLERNRQANEQFNRNYEERNNFFNNVGRVADSFLTGLGTTVANVGTGVLSVINDDPVNLATRSARDNLIGKIENTDLAGYAEKLKAIKNPTEQRIDWLSDIKRQNEAKIQNLQSQTDSEFAKNVIGFVPNLSQQVVNIGASLVNPGLGMAVATAGAKGSYLDVAKQRGMNEEESRTFSNIMAVVEGATEMIGINNITKGIKGVNALAKTGIKGAKKEIQKEIVDTAIKSYGKSILDNAVQEAITEPIQEAVADITAKKGDWNNILGRSLESGFSGALTAAITGGASMGISSALGYVQKVTNGYKPTQAETIQAVNQIYNEATENQKQVLNYAIKDGVDIVTQQSVLPAEENGLKSNVETNNTILESDKNNNIDIKDKNTVKNRQYLNKKFEELTGDTIPRAQAKLAGIEIRNNQRKNGNLEGNFENIPYSDEAMNLLKTYESSKKSSNYLYHSTSANNLQNIIENGLTLGNKQNQEGVSSKNKIYLASTEELANSFSPQDSVILRINPQYNIDDLDFDLLGGEGAYTTGKEIPTNNLQIKKDGKWINLTKYAAQNQAQEQINNKINNDEGQYAKVNSAENNQNTEQQNLLNRAKAIEELQPEMKGLTEEIQGYFKDYNAETYTALDEMLTSFEQNNPKDELKVNMAQGKYGEYDADLRKYKQNKPEYDKQIVNNALEFVRGRQVNGTTKRTKAEWLRTANLIGQNAANLTNDQVRDLAYGTWLDLAPNNKETLNRQGEKYVKFTSDEWANEIYNAVEQNRTETTQVAPEAKLTTEVTQEIPTTPAEEVTEMERPQLPQSQKSRKFYRSVIESDNTTAEAKQISRELMGYDSYTPQTNKLTLEQADRNIELNGTEGSLTTLTNKINNNDKITATDIATGQRLMQYYSKIGDKARLQEAIQDTAMAGTEAGRSVQAFAMLNHQTPEGQVTWIQRSIDKINKRLQKEGRKEQFEFTPEMQQEILNSTDKNRQQVLDKVYKELGEQVPKSHMEQFNEWRYFSMLFNPKTHIRNILGNAVMKQVQNIKNKVAGTIEDIVIGDNGERWNSLKRASKGTYQFAKNDLKNADVQSLLGLNENKYNPQNRLQQNQRTFKSDALENTLGKAFNFNSKALEVEDGWGLKSAYAKALTNYITANQLDYTNLSDADLQKARAYAVQQAKEATFHQENLMANTLQTWENKNLLYKIGIGGALPFKKTPMNVALTGFEYSPAGFIKTFTSDIVNLRKGKINANQFIDNISKNITGTGIAVLGYALTQAGILKASGGDDDKDKYEEALGKQNYSIQIGDNTYSLDWLTPAGIPLFIGSELYQVSHKDEKEGTKGENEALKSISNILDATSTAMNPMSEMSMISGLTSALKSYAQGSGQSIGTIGSNLLKSYLTQPVPTALGQIGRTLDDKERATSSTQTDDFSKAIDQTKNQIMSKIPGLRQLLPVSTDVWGNERKTTNYAENAILPWTRKEIKSEPVDKELSRLYDATGESAVIPKTSIDKILTIAKEKYRLSNEEYADLKKQYGQTSYKILSNLTSSSDYKNMTDEQKVKAVTEAYKYAKASLKVTYADWNNLDADANSTYKKVQNVIDKGGDAKDYFTYVGLTDGLKTETEKNRALRDSDLGSKSAIYESTTGSDDQIYPIMKKAKTNINAYLDYKLADIQGIKNEEGKTISGSKKQAFNDYLNSSKMNYNQKLLLKGVNYKLTNYEKNLLLDYLDTLKLSDNEYNDVLLKLK